MDTSTLTVIGLVVSIITGIIGVLFRRMNELDRRLRGAPDRDEVKDLIDTKLESVKVLQQEIKEDTKELSRKMDKLIHTINKG